MQKGQPVKTGGLSLEVASLAGSIVYSSVSNNCYQSGNALFCIFLNVALEDIKVTVSKHIMV